MTTLTLPIVVGKKYVRRDGAIVEATRIFEEDPKWMWFSDDRNRELISGSWFPVAADESDWDIVSDYIEPAKGHPHAALMAQFADDASKSETPWDQWQMLDTHGEWFDMTRPPEWHITSHYRRRPKTTPDPHAENAAEYAKDMAETDKAWERWECKVRQLKQWMDCYEHPTWLKTVLYRRKEQA